MELYVGKAPGVSGPVNDSGSVKLAALLDWLSIRQETSTSLMDTSGERRAAFFKSMQPTAPSPQFSTICVNRLVLLFCRPTFSVFPNPAATGLDV